MATKTLNFRTFGLQKDTAVVLVINPPAGPKLYRDQFPVVWKVLEFPALVHGKATVKYSPRPAIGYVQTESDSLVDASSWSEVNNEDIDKVIGGAGLPFKNESKHRANLSVGLVKGNGIGQIFEPIIMWRRVDPGSTVTAQFAPVLSAYFIRNYEVSQMLRGELEVARTWEQNLNELDDVTYWDVIQDSESGNFFIESAN
ncbi:hypothetical protein BDV93DRAFT_261110 [Ceratobasidium sp. AG-I]|nr:hypothetical protein BDV93DRAFT_261110 [Ceratobasidium sp. AG-I]